MVRLHNRLLHNNQCRLVLRQRMFMAQQVARPTPGAKPLTRPTERPDEPITAGADIGAGPNAMQAGLRPRFIPVDDNLETLKALYRMYPSDGLLEVISEYTNGKM
jgi:hypothetical protein